MIVVAEAETDPVALTADVALFRTNLAVSTCPDAAMSAVLGTITELVADTEPVASIVTAREFIALDIALRPPDALIDTVRDF